MKHSNGAKRRSEHFGKMAVMVKFMGGENSNIDVRPIGRFLLTAAERIIIAHSQQSENKWW